MSRDGRVRATIRSVYDIQKLRIMTGQRIVANQYIKMGLKPGTKIENLEDKEKVKIVNLKRSYKNITTGIVSVLKEKDIEYDEDTEIINVASKLPKIEDFKGDELITEYTEYVLMDSYIGLEKQEFRQMKGLEKLVHETEIWHKFFKHVRGCAERMAAVFISEIDIEKSKYPGSLCKLAGIDIGPDGRGRSKKEAHLIDVDYIDKDGKPATRKSITYNPFLKTKVMGVLGDCLVKLNKGQKYRLIYDQKKHFYECHRYYGIHNDGKKKDIIITDAEGKEKNLGRTSKGRRHFMAIRNMMKIFLQDMYAVWREIEGLPVYGTYRTERLGYDEHNIDLNLKNEKVLKEYKDDMEKLTKEHAA